jgi:formylglycine-generating enzyme required for sulfatase activity
MLKPDGRRDGATPPGQARQGALSALIKEVLGDDQDEGAGPRCALTPGMVVGRFEIIREIGRGGFGVVFEAMDRELGRRVAFKMVEVGSRKGEAEERLACEAEAAARLSHPNIVTVHDVGRTEAGRHVILELLEGRTLAERLQQGPLAVREALRIAIEVAKGLEHAHARGVLHRDLTPGNVFLCDDGRVKVLDLGMAHAFGRKQIEGGTPGFMPPEQRRGAPEDERTDVFALGALLRCMLSPGPTATRSAWRPWAGRAAPKVPELPALGPYIARMMDDDPVERPRGASEVLAALTAFGQELERAGPVGAAAISSLRPQRILAAAAVVAIVAGGAGLWLVRRERRIRWAVGEALPRIGELTDRGQYAAALTLAQEVARVVPEDPRLPRVWPQVSQAVAIETTPAGADVYVKRYAAPDTEWRILGRSPGVTTRLPLGYYRWRIEKKGFATFEAISRFGPSSHDAPRTLRFVLDPVDVIPPEMVRVPGGMVGIELIGLAQRSPVQIGDFLIDRTEVTNKQFKHFVDAGGYQRPELWRHPIVQDGRAVPWSEAMALFRDRTGRPGPATWVSGDYPDSQGDLPVTGVSWYEAEAYAAFVGKALPTVYQWSRAAGAWATSQIVPVSNFAGRGLAPVATHGGMGPYGTYDMAGNAKEWCWNANGENRFLLGGGWNEPSYMFNMADARSPVAREESFGFRLAKALEGTNDPAAAEPIPWFLRDYAKEKPVPPELFEAFKRQYAYDPADLDARVEEVDDGSERWRKEKVSFAAAYGGERVVAYLFTPRNVAPPWQTVVFFPTPVAMELRSSEELDEMAVVAPVVSSGRALLYPVYKSTYERGDALKSPYPSSTKLYREHVIEWAQDLGRSIDYAQTRRELDAERIALYGVCLGARLAPLLTAVDDRIKTAIMVGGGLSPLPTIPEVDPFNFAPYVRRPMLMVNGRYDFVYPVEAAQAPLFKVLGSPPGHKRHVVLEAGHVPPNDLLTREVLDWLDRYLGGVRR